MFRGRPVRRPRAGEIKFDHIGLPAQDPWAPASALAELLGAGPPAADGEDNDMFRVNGHLFEIAC